MDAPDYVVCLECETPCYLFEWLGTRLAEALCQTCGSSGCRSP